MKIKISLLAAAFFGFSHLASAQCGKLAVNPTTGKLDCIGSPGAATFMTTTTQLNMPKYKAALTAVRNGTGSMRILIPSDSIGAGFDSGSSPIEAGSWPTRLAALLTANGTPAINALVISGVTGTADPRFALGSAWTQAGFSTQIVSFEGAGTTGNLVLTPFASSTTVGAFAFSSVHAFWLGNNGGGSPVNPGTFTFTCTGGTPVVVNGNAQASQGMYSTTVNCGSSSATNTLTVSAAGSGTHSDFLGMELIPTSGAHIIFLNAGVSGASSNSWSVSNSGWGGLDFIKLIAPDACWIDDLGTNDSAPGGLNMPPATFSTNMTAIIGTCNNSSADIVLIDMLTSATAAQNPGSGDARALLEVQYLPVYAALTATQQAASQNATYFSAWNWWNGTWNYNNFMCGDALHPCVHGYDNLAYFMYLMLQ